MKKLLTLASIGVLSATMFMGCGNPTPKTNTATVPELPFSRITAPDADIADDATPPQDVETPNNDGTGNGDRHDNRKKHYKPSIPGVRRLFPRTESKTYAVEYIHVPYGIDRDETLDYNLTLNHDNTFDLTVVSEGVETSHYGHWYKRRGEIVMYYDEEIDPPAHNVYVADSLYGELLPHGKIMIYDKCSTIVLSRVRDNDTNDDAPETYAETYFNYCIMCK